MVRYRIKYQKVGAVRFTSHRDLLRIFRRCLAASGVPVCYSRGFNPHPRLSFGPSLRTGWESLDEYMDVLVEHPIDDLDARCNDHLPGGLKILAWARVEDPVPKLSADIKAARYEVIVDSASVDKGANARWDNYRKRLGAGSNNGGSDDNAPLEALENDLRSHFASKSMVDAGGPSEPSLLDIQISKHQGGLRVEYLSTMEQGRSLFPEMLERYVGDSLGMEVPMRVVRKALLVERDGAYYSPISKGVVRNLL